MGSPSGADPPCRGGDRVVAEGARRREEGMGGWQDRRGGVRGEDDPPSRREDLRDVHPVPGERPRLVRADDGDRSERLHGRELPDQGAARQHPLRAQGEGDRHHGGQPLRDRGDREAHGGEKQQHGILSPQQTHPEDEGDDRERDQREAPAEIGHPALERRRLLPHLGEHPGDPPQLGLPAGAGRHGRAAPVDDGGAEEKGVPPVADGKVGIGERIGGFLHGDGFAGQGGFVGAQGVSLDEAGVGRDAVPRLQQKDVAGDELPGGDLPDPSVPPHLHHGGGKARQRRHRLFGAVLLGEAEQRVQEDDGDDRDGVHDVAQQGGDDGRPEEDRHHRRRELGEKDASGAKGGAFGELVRTARAKPRGRLGPGQPGAGIGPKLPNDVRDLPPVPVAHGVPDPSRSHVCEFSL